MIANLMATAGRALGLSALMRAAGVVTRLMPIPQPTLLVGVGSSARLGHAVSRFGHQKVLIVTDRVIARLGLLNALTQALTATGLLLTAIAWRWRR